MLQCIFQCVCSQREIYKSCMTVNLLHTFCDPNDRKYNFHTYLQISSKLCEYNHCDRVS